MFNFMEIKRLGWFSRFEYSHAVRINVFIRSGIPATVLRHVRLRHLFISVWDRSRGVDFGDKTGMVRSFRIGELDVYGVSMGEYRFWVEVGGDKIVIKCSTETTSLAARNFIDWLFCRLQR